MSSRAFLPPTDTDNLKIERLFLKLNKQFFHNTLKAQVIWQVPDRYRAADHSREHGSCAIAHSLVDSRELIQLSRLLAHPARRELLLRHGSSSQLGQQLEQEAEAGDDRAALLLLQLKRHDAVTRDHYVERLNLRFRQSYVIPACGFSPRTNTIQLHPYLLDREAPRYVLQHLIYAQCRQLWQALPEAERSRSDIPETSDSDHDQRARTWLRQEHFPEI